ncbi:uncharacterized protein STEHIDRAFT_117744 [Stereum hirsutum FP-91666 SS1]|uniref:uncharacterized protein n=1 Tax=Stereum hirsutum (strain FP-91666) TaxID=721885 RepID=UPI000440A39D|nr:uncharacterized protein STEHIDRAFT_117744 [Stereum hirsutum FP-91666 SS1]EIM92779.1 hypothetical protein STEHIDRAFT_117744 [Stereum hirsutum FP-91666 SS1]
MPMTVTVPAFNAAHAVPMVSSPLASPTSPTSSFHQLRPQPRRTPSFPTARPLRPFASINNTANSSKKSVKLIEPPKGFGGTFVLDLTQAEFSRQD